jgi:hypothetical protein
MASTKAVSVQSANVTLTAGAGDTTATATDLQDGYSAAAFIKLTNGATGPTVAAQVQVEVSPDNSNFYKLGGPLVGSTANSAVTSWVVPLPQDAKYVRTVAGSNTAQDVTLRVEIVETSALS